MRLYFGLGIAAAFALLLGWALRLDHLRESWQAKHQALVVQAGAVVAAVREASGNPDAGWVTAAGQIRAMGAERRTLRFELDEQNRRIDEMAAEAVRLRAKAADLRRIADRAEAQRKAALERLSDMAITPGTRDDCLTLLREAETALDLVYEAGL